eukprot:scaffold241019_cov29-Tisochrysis_lutea.AAC.2
MAAAVWRSWARDSCSLAWRAAAAAGAIAPTSSSGTSSNSRRTGQWRRGGSEKTHSKMVRVRGMCKADVNTRQRRQPRISAWKMRANAALPMVSSDHDSSSIREGATPRSIRYLALAAASSISKPTRSLGAGRCVVPRERTR